MVQGNKKFSGGGKPNSSASKVNSAKHKKAIHKAHLTPKGNALVLPKSNFRDDAIDDRALSKAIDKSNEQKMAAKVIQGGGKMHLTDLTRRGKDLARDIRRKQVKKKLTRVEEKLKILKDKAEKEGLI